jgi:DNA-binding PadR family transcriptional regulator
VQKTLGINEALILAALTGGAESSVAEVADRVVRVRDVDDGSIYMALQRMTDRGLVTRRKERVRSADGRDRDIGKYRITGEGSRALASWEHDTQAVTRLRTAGRPA